MEKEDSGEDLTTRGARFSAGSIHMNYELYLCYVFVCTLASGRYVLFEGRILTG